MAGHFQTEEQKTFTLTITEILPFAFFIIVFLFVLLQVNSRYGNLLGFSYWLIPDSITNFELTKGLVNGEFTTQDFLASAGVPLYYSAFFYAGLAGFITANAFLLFIGIRRFGIMAVYVPLLLYPHYLQLLVLPSKDMMVLAIYFVTIYYLTKSDWLKAVLVAVAAYYVRDAAPFLLLPLTAVGIMIQKTSIRPVWIVLMAFAAGVVAFVGLEVFAGNLFVVSRNLGALENSSSDSLRGLGSGPAGYVLRVFFNLTNSAFRLTFIDERGFISVGSVFFYIAGISSLVCCCIAAWHVLKSKDKTDQIIATSYFVTLFIISINPFVQGRYLFPMAICASVIFFRKMNVRHLLQLYIFVIVISLVGRFFYVYMGISFPPHMEYLHADILSLIR